MSAFEPHVSRWHSGDSWVLCVVYARTDKLLSVVLSGDTVRAGKLPVTEEANMRELTLGGLHLYPVKRAATILLRRGARTSITKTARRALLALKSPPKT